VLDTAVRLISNQRFTSELQPMASRPVISLAPIVFTGYSAPAFGVPGTTIVPRAATSIPYNSVQLNPYTIERLGHHLCVVQCFGQQFRPPLKDVLGDCERLIRMPLFDPLRETLPEIGLINELWEMYRNCLGEGSHPVDRQDFNCAPRTERSRI